VSVSSGTGGFFHTAPGANPERVKELMRSVGYRSHLPQLDGGLFLTDGGIETVLIFHHGIDLPAFAAFVLLRDDAHEETLRRYYEPYLDIARRNGAGFVLESPTWRASSRWGAELGCSPQELYELNRSAIYLMQEIRDDHRLDAPIVISGCIGPQDDGYNPTTKLSASAAQEYHSEQIATFRGTPADMVTAITMTYADEAIGVARAAAEADLPAAISFTVEADGRLPSGQPLGEAVAQVDDETGGAPAYYMINCAHPNHFRDALEVGEEWQGRIRGLRANASTKSHAELDEAEELDTGDPVELGTRYSELKSKLPNLNVLGGCCGTDHRHVGEICRSWLGSSAAV
jgi:S-methylmethionine-dependent homocysteine/selenocysteine methylase